jgi:hypothetical protein
MKYNSYINKNSESYINLSEAYKEYVNGNYVKDIIIKYKISNASFYAYMPIELKNKKINKISSRKKKTQKGGNIVEHTSMNDKVTNSQYYGNTDTDNIIEPNETQKGGNIDNAVFNNKLITPQYYGEVHAKDTKNNHVKEEIENTNYFNIEDVSISDNELVMENKPKIIDIEKILEEKKRKKIEFIERTNKTKEFLQKKMKKKI